MGKCRKLRIKMKGCNHESVCCLNNICVSSSILFHFCQSFLINFICCCYFLETFQFLIIWDSGDKVNQFIIVDSPRFDQFLQKLICSPKNEQNSEWNKIQDNCHNEDDNKCQPRQEGNTEVENILDTFQHMGKKSKMFLYLECYFLHCLHLFFQTFLFSIISFAVSRIIIIFLLLLFRLFVPTSRDCENDNIANEGKQ